MVGEKLEERKRDSDLGWREEGEGQGWWGGEGLGMGKEW